MLHLQKDPGLRRLLPFAGGQGGQNGVPSDSSSGEHLCFQSSFERVFFHASGALVGLVCLAGENRPMEGGLQEGAGIIRGLLFARHCAKHPRWIISLIKSIFL